MEQFDRDHLHALNQKYPVLTGTPVLDSANYAMPTTGTATARRCASLDTILREDALNASMDTTGRASALKSASSAPIGGLASASTLARLATMLREVACSASLATTGTATALKVTQPSQSAKNTIIMEIVLRNLENAFMSGMVGTYKDAVPIAMMASTIMGTALLPLLMNAYMVSTNMGTAVPLPLLFLLLIAR